MNSSKYGKDIKRKAAQLELLIIAMVGATLGSLQIINHVFLNADIYKNLSQPVFDWFFSMAIIAFLVHFSFYEIRKVQEDLIEKGGQADKAQRRLQHIIDNTHETVFVMDRHGGFNFAGRPTEELTGYTASELVNMHIADILSPEYKSLIQSELIDYKNLGGRHLFVDFLRKDGRKTRVELSFMTIETDEPEHVIQCLASKYCPSEDTEATGLEAPRPGAVVAIRQLTDGWLNGDYLELSNILHKVMLRHDPATALHQMRLAALVRQVGEEMSMADTQIEWLILGALLHDVGKLAVPNKILNKPGKLSDNEFTAVRLHAKHGIELLGSANLPPVITDMILHHHERLDGSGYPHNLKAGDLTMETRILSVCDVTESMISDRSYRQAMASEEVAHILIQGKGTKFDSDVVDYVLGVMNNTAQNSLFYSDNNLLKVV